MDPPNRFVEILAKVCIEIVGVLGAAVDDVLAKIWEDVYGGPSTWRVPYTNHCLFVRLIYITWLKYMSREINIDKILDEIEMVKSGRFIVLSYVPFYIWIVNKFQMDSVYSNKCIM